MFLRYSLGIRISETDQDLDDSLHEPLRPTGPCLHRIGVLATICKREGGETLVDILADGFGAGQPQFRHLQLEKQ